MRDTIELAREAGFPMAWISDNDGGVIRWKDIKAFEALVRADEREACAELVYHSPPSDEYESPLKAVYNAIRARGDKHD
jgi:hypothetical protein